MNSTNINLLETLPIAFYLAIVILSIIGIAANAVVIILIFSKSSIISSNMAITCSCCCAAICFATVRAADSLLSSLAASQLKWFLQNCVFDNITQLTFESIYNIHIAILSLEKFYLVVYPFKHQRMATKANTIKLLLVVWFVPCVSLMFTVKIAVYASCRCCLPWFFFPTLKNVIFNGILPILFVLPPLITMLVYAIILYKLHQSRYTLIHPSSIQCQNGQYIKFSRNKKALIQASVIVTFYIITFLPIFIIIYNMNRNNFKLFVTPFLISNIMITLFVCLHPVLIIYFNVLLKSEAKRRLFKCFQHC